MNTEFTLDDIFGDSLNLTLDEENKKGTFKKGMKIIMVAFGGGLSYGSSLINWT